MYQIQRNTEYNIQRNINYIYLCLFCGIFSIITMIAFITRDNHGSQNIKIKENTKTIEYLTREVQQLKHLLYTVQMNAKVTVTHYSPSVDETDKDPYITAFLKRVKVGYIAVSRDLMLRGWTPGRKVYIPGEGIFIIADLMNKRKGNWIDMFVPTKKEANEKGIRRDVIATLFLEGF